MKYFLPHRKAYDKSRWKKKKARIWKRACKRREQAREILKCKEGI